MTAKSFKIEFQPNIPKGLSGLSELANDLYYGWNSQARRLFRRLDDSLWQKCNHNPKLFLRNISQEKLDAALNDGDFKEEYARVLSTYNAYRKLEMYAGFEGKIDPNNDLVAYLCLEFGFHESVPIYSGGLGILAGDLCKAASDMAIPFVAVGLLYRQGYFTQEVDGHGNQIDHHIPTEFDNLPIKPCMSPDGQELRVHIELPGRSIALKIWEATAGNIKLYLLDSDISENSAADRKITYQLYGAGKELRMLQEIVLGLGSVRALRALNLHPTVWHINEGHAAFSMLERCRESVTNGIGFNNAIEINASNVVFTTHTPVPAGHDVFSKDIMQKFFSNFVNELGIDFDTFINFGNVGDNDDFNMTTLALRFSRFHNGVSRIHHGIASTMESRVWPQISDKENPIGYVTNGAHISTFLATEWKAVFDMRFGNWRSQMNNEDFWECIYKIPSHRFWSVRRELKSALLVDVYKRLLKQYRRNGYSQSTINRITQHVHPHNSNTLIFGFARRFATYKRAHLLFYDIERFEKLVNNPDRPVILIFAGKAHPSDEPGKELIKHIHELSQRPSFQGKLLFIEGYDISLARKLVSGVDIWLNNPEYPLEASGTSGMKAGMNGAVNLSIMDGWWDEGYNGKNGWGIMPHPSWSDIEYRNHKESCDLHDIIEHEVLPLYFNKNGQGYSEEWVNLAKESMKTIIPNFNSERMLSDYVNNFYLPAINKSKLICTDKNNATELTSWKAKIRSEWSNVNLSLDGEGQLIAKQGKIFTIVVDAYISSLNSEDVIVECLINEHDTADITDDTKVIQLSASGKLKDGHQTYKLACDATISGQKYMRVRMYPHHKLLCHKFELGCMTWVEV
jgi:starch phosphorylase